MTRVRLLTVLLRVWAVASLLIFGTIFTGYATQSPLFGLGGALHWMVWDDLPGHVALMLSLIYLVWAVHVWIAAGRPQADRSFLEFTMWANLAHGLVMIPGALEHGYHSKFLTDIPWVLLLSATIAALRPALGPQDARLAGEAAR